MNEDHLRDIKQGTGTPFIHGPMSQTYSALYWFEQIIREIGAKSVLEIGTGSGHLALFFGLLCPGNVVTCDIFDIDVHRAAETPGSVFDLYRRLGISYLKRDGQDPAVAAELVAGMLHPLFVLCDDGNKPLEFEVYTPLLQPGDAIAVHDNPSEFKADSPKVAEFADAHSLTRWRRDELDADLTRLAIWIKA